MPFHVPTYVPSATLLASVPVVPDPMGKILYDTSYYDGPLAGLLEWGGERLYFQVLETTPNGVRHFGAYRLTAESQAWEDRRNARWLELGGEPLTGITRRFSPDRHTAEEDRKPPKEELARFWDEYPADAEEPLYGDLVARFDLE